VKLKGGEKISSRVVVSNADLKRTFLKLVGSDYLDNQFVSKVMKLKTSVSSFKFHASLRKLPRFTRHFKDGSQQPPMGVTWIAPSVDYVRNCWRDIKERRAPSSPIMEVQTPATYDNSLTPPGNHILSVWCPYVPPHLEDGTWEDESLVERESDIMIERLSRYLPELPESIIDSKLFTPLDLEKRVHLTDGNIRHIDMIPDQLSSSRPLEGWSSYRTPIEGLFLCGAGAHPGGEVTGAPGHNAAQVVLRTLTSRT
jgi:phytoene dehydrogenase-like protein